MKNISNQKDIALTNNEKLLSERIHSDEEIKNIASLRKKFKNKSPKFVEENLKNDKEVFIQHYDNLFNKGASEFPGILELYSLLKTKRSKPNLGKGCCFKMIPYDAQFYGKDIVKYFLVKNVDVFPLSSRAKISLDAYIELLTLSRVDNSDTEKIKIFYYNKYKLNKNIYNYGVRR